MGLRRPEERPRRGSARRVLALLSAVPLLLATAVVAVASPASAAPAPSPACVAGVQTGPSSIGRFHGIAHPQSTPGSCAPRPAARAATTGTSGAISLGPGAAPPLINHGGPVMSTPSTGNQVVVPPIFWSSGAITFTQAYRDVITQYLTDVAADSEKTTNVFSTMFQYSGSNGAINYRMTLGTPILDTHAYPLPGCTTDSGSVYADTSGYTTCLDDDQVTAETDAVLTANSLPRDLGHLYVVFLPKHVESCFLSDAQAAAGTFGPQACTINPNPVTSAYCAYHSGFGPLGHQAYYATMPFPIYSSATRSTCTTESLTGGVQHPNGDVDADVETSPLSHEMAEAITDPEGSAWSDSAGNENGDDCGYVYGTVLGADGVHFNQTINGHQYLTQEEFSNADFQPVANATNEPCLQSIAPVAPTVTGVSPATGPIVGGRAVTITGTGLTGAVAVQFGTVAVATSAVDSTHVTAVAPPHAVGSVDIRVITHGRVSAAVNADNFGYVAAPTISSVSPAVGQPGTSVTITGTGLASTSSVAFGGVPATFLVVTPTQVTATAPAHAGGTVDITVTADGGTSATTAADRFSYPVMPTVASISPAAGPLVGGGTVTITGTDLGSAGSVTFGSTAATFVVVDAAHVTATVPAHAAGVVDVVVTSPGGSSPVVSGDRFTYLAAPAVTRVAPAAGPLTGGTLVTITGSGFVPGAVVTVGGHSATSVTVASSTRITARVPAHAAALLDVRVTTPGGTSTIVAADRFRYLPRPVVTTVSPTSGRKLGGLRITVRGSGFVAGAVVRFGTVAGRVVSLTSTRIVVTTPRHAKGRVSVTVVTPGGVSAARATARYLFV